jgi:hypothetical protein
MTPLRPFASPAQGGAAPAVQQSRPGGASRRGVVARRQMVVFLAAGPLVGPARATHAGPPVLLPGARRLGQARLRFFGLSVYDAVLWAEAGFEAALFERHRFVLELHYLRTLYGKAIAERSLKEMRGVGSVSDAQATRWLDAMTQLFPDVKDGDHIAGLHLPGEGARFTLNGRPLGEVPDAEFARLFFGIWLSSATSEPQMRTQLLAQAGTNP